MTLLILAYLGGVFTIISPCILPVLPFVFSRADRPFLRSGLPMLVGMAVTFAAVATLAAVGGGWAVHANQYGRLAALVVLVLLGLTLISRRMADTLSKPFVALGDRLSRNAEQRGDSVLAAAGLGVATGLLWAPCAGPILGLILTGAALRGASAQTSLLLFAYALGAATSLALALLIGGRIFTVMKRSLGAGEWIRRILGVLVLAGVASIVLGLNTGLLTRLSAPTTNGIEQSLINHLRPPAKAQPVADHNEADNGLPVEGEFPSLKGATGWINSPPLTRKQLRGKVVLVDFWTYSCINCIRSLPYVEAWARKYKHHGLVVIGVHSPEFAFEKNEKNVREAVKRFGITYPVAVDSDYAIWRGFNNQYWPADYFIDAHGRIRGHYFGEGDYRHSEDLIRKLLRDAGHKNLPGGYVKDNGQGAEAAAAGNDQRSPETYVGYARAEGFAGGMLDEDNAHDYNAPTQLAVNHWAFDGRWTVRLHDAVSRQNKASIVYRFQGRDLNLVMGPGSNGRSIRIRVTVDGKPPGKDHGTDVNARGYGTVDSHRLYQLVRQADGTSPRRVRIQFLDPRVHVYAFTFG